MAYRSPEAEEARKRRRDALMHLTGTMGAASDKWAAQTEKDERAAAFLRQKARDDADVPWWKRAATGVLQGAATGSAAGPWGALVGGLAGGVLGGTGVVDFGAPTGTDLAGAMGAGMATYRDYQRGEDQRAARDRLLAMYERSMGGGVPSQGDTSLSGALNRAREAAYGGTGITIPSPTRNLWGQT
jgi:hypothetical protein